MTTLHVTEIHLHQLHRAPWNHNVVGDDVLARIRQSIDTFGVVEPLVVRPLAPIVGKTITPHFEVISGNHRLELYREMNLDTAPCVIRELDDTWARILADTLNHTRGNRDPDLYHALLTDIAAGGLTPDQMAAYLNNTASELEALLRSDSNADDTAPAPAPANDRTTTLHQLVITCHNETEQQALYDELTSRGHDVRVLTM